MARKAVRLSDIAEKLGVSTVTVSNALANQRGVSEELREKIKEMASEMGYHAPGTQIMAKTAVNIGVLVQERIWEMDHRFIGGFIRNLPLRVRLTIVFWHSAC